ncbi:MAG: pentapeptide repeat-containing protein [Microcystis flos-aquae DF17]|nr:MAG: pentapeptide repeat-containing protein [Microcystis flos-aquae DF17]
MMMNELKMTEIKPPSWTELEMLVNDLKKKHTNKLLTDVETKILKGIFDDKKYADLAEEIRQEEQSIKNAAYDLFKILSEQTGQKIGKSNLITALAKYRDNSQTFDHNNKPQTQQSNKVLELVIEVGIDDLTPEKIDKINNLIQKIARDNTIKPIMKLKGSIRLFLEGSEEGLKHLADLHQSGELQARLNKHKSDDIPEIVVTKAEFTTDAKVIEKAELIKAIREGTIDKTTLQQVDLRGADLRGADLIWAFLSEANLSGANLSDANLRGADLRGADLSGAILRRAFLSGAILSDANLRGADLSGAILSGADVENAIFIDATGITPEQKQDLIRLGAIFGDTSNEASIDATGITPEQKQDLIRREAIFGDTSNEASKEINNKLIESIKKPNLPQPIFERTNQKEADLSGAFLRGDDLRGAILKRADLRGANLIEADLSAAILIEANLSDAKLSGANLRGAILIEADLSKADLSGADLSGANLSGADLRRADLSDANLSAAEVKNAIFTGATGITREQKRDLIRRGAIFGDNSNDRSKVLV